MTKPKDYTLGNQDTLLSFKREISDYADAVAELEHSFYDGAFVKSVYELEPVRELETHGKHEKKYRRKSLLRYFYEIL